MNEHENDPQFQYYNSDAESIGSHNSHEFYGNGDVGVVSPTSPGWNKDIGNKTFGISGKNLAQSNLQKHKSLSTPLFDLTKLDTIETAVDVDGDDDDDDDDTYALQNEAYDTDNDEDQPGRLRCILVCVEVKEYCKLYLPTQIHFPIQREQQNSLNPREQWVKLLTHTWSSCAP